MFRFADPYWLLLAIPLGVASCRVFKRNVVTGIPFAPFARIPGGRKTWRQRIAAILPILLIGGMILSIVAMARPQTVLSKSHRSADAIAIQMALDVSGSMSALDLSERTAAGMRYRTRLDAVKETFAQFVEKRTSDLIGLVSFGGYATARAPLTADHRALIHILKGVEIPREVFDTEGRIVNQEELLTAIGDGLATACAHIENAEPKSRIVVLLSDGESNTGVVKPAEAMQAAKALGVRVYTIGVGTSGRAPFRARDMFGRETIQYADVTLDEELLRKIASATGGQYFNVRDPKGLEKAMESIDALEKTKVERDVYHRYHELFLWFLLPGMALILLSSCLAVGESGRIV